MLFAVLHSGGGGMSEIIPHRLEGIAVLEGEHGEGVAEITKAQLPRFPQRFGKRQSNQLRHLSDNFRPDFAAFSCNTQSIPSKKRLHQDKKSLEICSR